MAWSSLSASTLATLDFFQVLLYARNLIAWDLSLLTDGTGTWQQIIPIPTLPRLLHCRDECIWDATAECSHPPSASTLSTSGSGANLPPKPACSCTRDAVPLSHADHKMSNRPRLHFHMQSPFLYSNARRQPSPSVSSSGLHVAP